MKIVDFAQFARRREAHSLTVIEAAVRAPQTDRWAMLHTASVESPTPARDFWSDLQLRMAYPTYQFRRH